MRRRCCFLIALVALALAARPQAIAACSILPVPPEQQARMVQDTIDRADLIARATVVGTRPVAVDGRYYQQLTLGIAVSWRGASTARVTVVGPTLSADTGPGSILGVFSGTAPVPACGTAPRAVGDDLLILARHDGEGRLRLSSATTPNDPLAATLRAQLGAGVAPPPSPPALPFVWVLLVAGIVLSWAALVRVLRRTPHWFRAPAWAGGAVAVARRERSARASPPCVSGSPPISRPPPRIVR